MPSMQLRVSRHAVHTVGITENGVLYIDVQRFRKWRSAGARTFYVRAADVVRVKHLAAGGLNCRASGRGSETMTDEALIKLMAASFHSAQYALEWLRWARIPTYRHHDEEACYNAEERAAPTRGFADCPSNAPIGISR